MHNLIINNTTRSKLPRLPYADIAQDIVGKSYNLSLNFIGATRAQTLNRTYRQKNYVPNVLSFPLDQKTGEIYIAPVVAKKEAPKFDLSTKGYIGYLFIHGCLHLKGYDHGAKMEQLEQKYMKKYRLQ